MPSNEIFFSSNSWTHLFHNLVEEKCSDDQETENPPVGVCVGRERQQSVVLLLSMTEHTYITHQTQETHTHWQLQITMNTQDLVVGFLAADWRT